MNWKTYEDVCLRIVMGCVVVIFPTLIVTIVVSAFFHKAACP